MSLRFLITHGDNAPESGQSETVVCGPAELERQIVYLIENFEVDPTTIRVWVSTTVEVETTGYSIKNVERVLRSFGIEPSDD